MKILIAPNAYKESLSAYEACLAIEEGFLAVNPKLNITKFPLADGGDGSVEALSHLTGSKIIKCEVKGPLGKEINSQFLLFEKTKTAVIEMALASGIAILDKKDRNPMKTTTYGTGQLISIALGHNIKKIIICIGGSATVDGGIGMAQALGVSFKDKGNKEVPYGGKGLEKINSINPSNINKRLRGVEIIVACDVVNPLTGKSGAAKIYGPQKGATPAMLDTLDLAMENYAKLIKTQINKDIANIKGAGAAGGLGAGLMGFLDAKLMSGFKIISDILNLEENIKKSDIIITGEGKMDKQSFYGKVPGELMKLCDKYNKKLICIAGSLGDDLENNDLSNNTSCFSTLRKLDNKKSILPKAYDLVKSEAINIGKLLYT